MVGPPIAIQEVMTRVPTDGTEDATLLLEAGLYGWNLTCGGTGGTLLWHTSCQGSCVVVMWGDMWWHWGYTAMAHVYGPPSKDHSIRISAQVRGLVRVGAGVYDGFSIGCSWIMAWANASPGKTAKKSVSGLALLR